VNSKPEKQKPARVLIVDDHAIVRYGMGVLLSGANDLTLCGEAGTFDEALAAIRELRPDVAVIDIILHDRNGLDLIRRIRAEEDEERKTEDRSIASRIPHPAPPRPLPILVLSMHNESTHAEKALRAGAQGYIMKEEADEVLVEALRTVLGGKLYVSGSINEKLLRTYIDNDGDGAPGGIGSLTSREKEIFECLGRGLTTRKIAEQFNLSPRTVEVHRARIKKKLACEDAAQLLRMAVQWVESRTA
jgi:DNA-binding NarL/FixJ family response regulator